MSIESIVRENPEYDASLEGELSEFNSGPTGPTEDQLYAAAKMAEAGHNIPCSGPNQNRGTFYEPSTAEMLAMAADYEHRTMHLSAPITPKDVAPTNISVNVLNTVNAYAATCPSGPANLNIDLSVASDYASQWNSQMMGQRSPPVNLSGPNQIEIKPLYDAYNQPVGGIQPTAGFVQQPNLIAHTDQNMNFEPMQSFDVPKPLIDLKPVTQSEFNLLKENPHEFDKIGKNTQFYKIENPYFKSNNNSFDIFHPTSNNDLVKSIHRPNGFGVGDTMDIYNKGNVTVHRLGEHSGKETHPSNIHIDLGKDHYPKLGVKKEDGDNKLLKDLFPLFRP